MHGLAATSRTWAAVLLAATLMALARATIVCDPNSVYRSFDGSCNNLEHPGWGVSFDQGPDGIPDVYMRFNYTTVFGIPIGGYIAQVDAGNNDGIFIDVNDTGKTYVDITTRKSPRDLLINEAVAGVDLLSYPTPASPFLPPMPRRYASGNLLYTFIGQLVAHDFAETAGPGIDPFVASPNRIASFIKSGQNATYILGAPTYDVVEPDSDGFPRQFNNATAYLDLSFVYGPTVNVSNALRAGHGGLLRTLGTKTFNYTATNIPNRDLCDCTFTFPNGVNTTYMKFDGVGFNTIPLLTTTTSGFTPSRNRITEGDNNATAYPNACYSSDPCSDSRVRELLPVLCNNSAGKMLPVVIGCQNPITSAPAPFQPQVLPVTCTFNVTRYNDGKHNSAFITIDGDTVGNEWQPLASEVDSIVPTDKLLALTDDRREIPAAGDPRNVENFAILVLHNLFLREHNRKARELALENLDWTDEQIFQEARKWNIALWQKILHTEYLPYTVGQSAYAKSSLSKSYAQAGGYQNDVDPRISNVFSAAAFRFAHSMVPLALFPRHPTNMSRVTAKQNQLYDHFFGLQNPGPSIKNYLNVPAAGQINGFALTFSHLAFMQSHLNTSAGEKIDDAIMAALLVQQSQANDRYVERSIADFQISSCFTPFRSVSVSAIDVFRCRTHGCAGYGVVRDIFTNSSLYSTAPGCVAINSTTDSVACFTALAGGDSAYGTKLQQYYKKIANIDPFVGMIIETESFAEPKAMVGKTTAAVILKEFEKMRASDRFWYEGSAVGLSTSERGKLTGRNLAKLIQDHHTALGSYIEAQNLGRKNVFDGSDMADPTGVTVQTSATFGSSTFSAASSNSNNNNRNNRERGHGRP